MPSNSPLANLPGARARRMTMHQRRVRALIILTVVVILAVLLGTCLGGGSGHSTHSTTSSSGAGGGTSTRHAQTIEAVAASLATWKLLNPLSRAILLPGSATATQLVILGGLTASGTSAEGVYTLDTATGKLALAGNLTHGLHDAAGAVIGAQDFAFGGGSPATVATVQSIPAPGAAAALATATTVGTLPQPRSDATAVTVGLTTYLVGGYDGTNPDPVVLATTDGTTFASVASLPVPVRYPAVAAVGGIVYVFGGQAVAGPGAGEPVDDIQAVNPSRHTATVAGHLPVPLEAAAAVTLGDQIYLAGGDSPAAGASTTTSSSAAAGAAFGEKASGTSTVTTIWAFDPATVKMLTAGQLPVAVSHGSVAVLGSTAWLVGGETNGTSVSVVQMITPNPSSRAA